MSQYKQILNNAKQTTSLYSNINLGKLSQATCRCSGCHSLCSENEKAS